MRNYGNQNSSFTFNHFLFLNVCTGKNEFRETVNLGKGLYFIELNDFTELTESRT